MKHLQAITLFLCVITALTFGCTSSGVRFQPAGMAWPAVENDYIRGIADGVEDGDLDATAAQMLYDQGYNLGEILSREDVEALYLIPWGATMRPWADRGVADKLEDGEVGPLVADELLEQIINFTTVIQSLKD